MVYFECFAGPLGFIHVDNRTTGKHYLSMIDVPSPNGNGSDSPDENAGGQGGPPSLEPGSGQTSDSRMIERAIRERWDIPEKYRSAIVQRQIKVAIDPEASNRESSIACRCLLEMERQNQADEHKQMPSLHIHGHGEIEGVVIELPPKVDAIEHDEPEGNGKK